MGKVNERALGYIFIDKSVSYQDLLERIRLPPMETRRIQDMLLTTQQTPTAWHLREGTPLVQELPVRQTAVYSNWNIIVRSPNDNSRGTSGVYLRPDAVYTLYE